MKQNFDVIVLGAGAAGLMCAIEAGKRGRSVAVLERADKIGKKIRISGGGRCNFTNLHAAPKNFLSRNIHFCKSALARYTPQDFVALVEKHRIPYHEKKLGQLFCDRTAEDIIAMLEAECKAARAQIRTGCEVQDVSKAGDFRLKTSQGEFRCKSLVVATGGLSIPQMGATAFGHELAKRFGLAVAPCRPALVPLTWGREDLGAFGELAGVAVDPAETSIGDVRFREAVLFTHRGLSGPAILQISSYWVPGNPIHIDLLPDVDVIDDLAEGRKRKLPLAAVLSKRLPRRLAQRWSDRFGPSRTLSQCTGNDLHRVSEQLHHWRVLPAGTEGYEKAEVTAGGVDTDELSSKTMESNKVPGLFFIGEAVDVTGHLGGFNFQWAWASGFAAGQAV